MFWCVCKSACILDSGCMHVIALMDSFIHNHMLFYRKELCSSYYISLYLYVYTVHNQAIPQPFMYVEIEIPLLCFPNTAIVYTLLRALSGL